MHTMPPRPPRWAMTTAVLRLASLSLAMCAIAVGASAQAVGASRQGATEVRPGDRILLVVDAEPALTDTFTVGAGPAVELPVVGRVPLAGVLRSDVQRHLSIAVTRVIRDPIVHARTLVRVAVLGEVASPGFYVLPADALLSDAITVAGGLTSEAEMKKVQLSRRGEILGRGGPLRNAIADGRTLDDLGLEAGDELWVPRRHDSERTVRILGLLVAIPLTAFALTRM